MQSSATLPSPPTLLEISGAVLPPARLADSALVIIKPLPNSFARTPLDETLKKLGRRNLIVAGFMTHMCVSATVRSALDHGYRCTVVAAACATRDLPDGHGGVVPAEVVHRASLAALADRFATVIDTSDGIPD